MFVGSVTVTAIEAEFPLMESVSVVSPGLVPRMAIWPS